MQNILVTEKSTDYELLDSGGGEKLERYGNLILSRPEPQAIWEKTLKEEWEKVDAKYTRDGALGKWDTTRKLDELWKIKLDGIVFNLKLLPSKHIGVFLEQLSQWKWLEEKIKQHVDSGKPVSVLNLFAYTGGASIFCARAGASVCHIDASKFPVDFAHENLKDSGLGDKPVRFIVDDVRKFVEREIKRGNKYDVIIMDPPVYGKGTGDKVWQIEEDLMPFLSRVKSIVSDEPLALVINGYASIYSAKTYERMLGTIIDGGELSSGELAIKESSSDKLLPCGIFTRWNK